MADFKARWQVGSIGVNLVEESIGFTTKLPPVFFPQFEREKFDRHVSWMAPIHYDPPTDQLVSSVHSWVIRTGRHTILFDCCAGNHRNRPWAPRWHMLETPWLERLRAVGVEPEDVDYVLCSHLHVDHCGWNTMQRDGRWVPTFPNAKYLIHNLEHEHWNPLGSNRGPRAEMAEPLWTDSVLPILEAGQVELVQGSYQIEEGVVIEEAPGHTPGLVTLRIESDRQHAVFSSDVIHHPIQICEAGWNTVYCELPEQALKSRMKLLEYCLRSDATMFPAHFAVPHIARIKELPSGLMPDFAL